MGNQDLLGRGLLPIHGLPIGAWRWSPRVCRQASQLGDERASTSGIATLHATCIKSTAVAAQM